MTAFIKDNDLALPENAWTLFRFTVLCFPLKILCSNVKCAPWLPFLCKQHQNASLLLMKEKKKTMLRSFKVTFWGGYDAL